VISGAVSISRGLPAIHVLNLAGNRKLDVQSPSKIASDEVVLSAVKNPPRIGEPRPIAAFLPEVLARYGLTTTPAPVVDLATEPEFAIVSSQTSIDVTV
jgi:hypothetical protein